mmetsp:Transcript_23430/g.55832  ORF Transcript_23430/g.55832 Transcript_23430/m.55832 type:complete len:251 (+) Transcript_23430:339-1091(+)
MTRLLWNGGWNKRNMTWRENGRSIPTTMSNSNWSLRRTCDDCRTRETESRRDFNTRKPKQRDGGRSMKHMMRMNAEYMRSTTRDKRKSGSTSDVGSKRSVENINRDSNRREERQRESCKRQRRERKSGGESMRTTTPDGQLTLKMRNDACETTESKWRGDLRRRGRRLRSVGRTMLRAMQRSGRNMHTMTNNSAQRSREGGQNMHTQTSNGGSSMHNTMRNDGKIMSTRTRGVRRRMRDGGRNTGTTTAE